MLFTLVLLNAPSQTYWKQNNHIDTLWVLDLVFNGAELDTWFDNHLILTTP